MVRITEVTVLGEHRVDLSFNDGSRRIVDLNRFLDGPIFEPIRNDPEFFRSVRVDPALGTIVWPNGADICPDLIFHDLEVA